VADRLPIIAIIGGTGNEGMGLALRWAAAGYKIIIGSRQEEKAKSAAEKINHRLGINSVEAMENTNAAKMADICVLTVMHSAHQTALESLKNVLHNKILIDATSRVDFKDPKPPKSPSAAQQAVEILDSSMKVVGAFQNVPARLLVKDVGEAMDADVLVCSDELPAAEIVLKLAEAAGMRGFYAGGLENSNVVEGITSLLISLNRHYGVKDASIKVAGISKSS
jgi:NADPH-dependent F420 reductase